MSFLFRKQKATLSVRLEKTWLAPSPVGRRWKPRIPFRLDKEKEGKPSSFNNYVDCLLHPLSFPQPAPALCGNSRQEY